MKYLLIIALLLPSLAQADRTWLPGGPLTVSTLTVTDIKFPTDLEISASTSDGGDTALLALGGGGVATNSRGANMQLWGNEHASRAGDIDLVAGTTSGARINIYNGQSGGDINIDADTNTTMQIDTTTVATFDSVGLELASTAQLGVGKTPDELGDGSIETTGSIFIDMAAGYGGVFFAGTSQTANTSKIVFDGTMSGTGGGLTFYRDNATFSGQTEVLQFDNYYGLVTAAGYGVNAGAGWLEMGNATALPATCTVGTIFHDTDSDDCADTGSGDGAICVCKSTNTWALVANI